MILLVEISYAELQYMYVLSSFLTHATARSWRLRTHQSHIRVMPQVKWDTYIAHYGSDCDFYASAKSRGWHVANHNQICPEAAIKVAHTMAML